MNYGTPSDMLTWCLAETSGALKLGAGADVFNVGWSNYKVAAVRVINGEWWDIKQLLRMIKWRPSVGELCEHVAN